VKELIAQLEAGRSDALTAYLDAMSRFHNYSFGNVLEIARQRPTATRVAGMYAWNQLGRRVRKGEKGVRTRRAKPDSNVRLGDSALTTGSRRFKALKPILTNRLRFLPTEEQGISVPTIDGLGGSGSRQQGSYRPSSRPDRCSCHLAGAPSLRPPDGLLRGCGRAICWCRSVLLCCLITGDAWCPCTPRCGCRGVPAARSPRCCAADAS
jgi:hypothetical protein